MFGLVTLGSLHQLGLQGFDFAKTKIVNQEYQRDYLALVLRLQLCVLFGSWPQAAPVWDHAANV